MLTTELERLIKSQLQNGKILEIRRRRKHIIMICKKEFTLHYYSFVHLMWTLPFSYNFTFYDLPLKSVLNFFHYCVQYSDYFWKIFQTSCIIYSWPGS